MEAFKSKKTIGALIHPGFYDQLVLIGFPFDEGSKSSGLRVGAAYGPDCFRRFLHKLGPIHNAEYEADLSKITLCDYGNISAQTMKARYDKLTTKIQLAMGRGQFTFVLGGSRDLVPFCAKGILEYLPGLEMPKVKGKSDSTTHKALSQEDLKPHKVLIIGVAPGIDTDAGEIFSSSKYIWRKVFEDPSFVSTKSKVVIFGASPLCDKNNYDYFTSKGGSVIWLNDIRKQKTVPDPLIQTQAAKAFEQLITSQASDYEHVYGAMAPGVTEMNGVGGLTGEEASEIAYLSGKCEKTKLMDLTEFNPRIEDYKTGRLAISIFYYLLLGLHARKLTV